MTQISLKRSFDSGRRRTAPGRKQLFNSCKSQRSPRPHPHQPRRLFRSGIVHLGQQPAHIDRPDFALERAAATLRERTAIQYERRAQSAQARLSIKILTWLPVAFLGWQIITNPLARWFLFASPFGRALLVGGLGLNWYGRRWMNRVVLGAI